MVMSFVEDKLRLAIRMRHKGERLRNTLNGCVAGNGNR